MRHKFFVLGFLSPFFAIAPVLALFAFALVEVGETASLTQVVERQVEDDRCLFGSATYDSFQQYKTLLLESSAPSALSLGSSRVMQFNRTMFRDGVEFVNAGGLVNSVAELTIAADATDYRDVDIVIIGVDPWWFNSKVGQFNVDRLEKASDDRPWSRPTPAMLYRAVRTLLDGSLLEALSTARSDDCRFGVAAHFGNGFWGDGSRSYGRVITGRSSSSDIAFRNTIHRIDTGADVFEWVSEPDAEAIAVFLEAVRRIASQGPEVVVFSPPFAPSVYDYMKKFDYGYIDILHETLRDSGIELYDFSNGLSVSSPDCEFVDGIHGGEVTYGRILRELSEHNEKLSLYVSQNIDDMIRAFAGNLSSNWHGQYDRIAPDPLQIGCDHR